MGGFWPLLMALLIGACTPAAPPREGEIAVGQALGGQAAPGFARALEPRAFQFPEDHGAHPAFKNEWWYLTGNLQDPEGRPFGFQFTLFRIGLRPEPPARSSRWATHQVWMAHAALSDVAKRRHHAQERFAREALGLAGARLDPFKVWLEDWRLEGQGNEPPWQLTLEAETFALDLSLESLTPPMLQGDRGLSQKSAEPGNASHYYSLPRLATRGRIRVQGRWFQVQGLSWLDREWSTSALGPDQVGWDWFALQLRDGTDIMYYQLRQRDGGVDPHSRGSARLPDGRQVDLPATAVRLRPLEHWTSPQGARYPVAWSLELLPLGRALEVRARFPEQLMDLSVRYWEGAVEVREAGGGQELGRGYLEMTGY